ncbi:MAG: hypothetical protein LYZ69_08950 [Nitrososphaerales archaeon]|nr:hypothetical protein [Nitrososphaerales archaeon]
MELKPTKGLKVKVNARREAVFGEESVAVKKVALPDGKGMSGIMTGVTLAGYCEVEMPGLDGQRHWYPIDELLGEKGEKVVEEVLVIEDGEGDEDDSEE